MTPSGRLRDPGIEERATSATLMLLIAKGYTALRIDDIAEASGVAKSTIYRRWDSLAHLTVDAIASITTKLDFEPTDNPKADLRRVCGLLASSVCKGLDCWLTVALDIHGQDDEGLRSLYRERVVEPPRRLVVDTLTRMRATGQLRSTMRTTDLADLLIGAIIYRLVVLRDPQVPSAHSQSLQCSDGVLAEPPRSKRQTTGPVNH